MTPPTISAGDKVLALGDFEQGKTTGLAYLAGAHDAAMVFDPEGELDPLDPLHTMDPDRWTQIYTLDRLDEVDTPCVSVCLAYQQVDEFCRHALENLGPNRAVGLMEMGSAIPGTSPGSVPTHLGTLWRTAHKQNTTILAESHRTSELPKILRRAKHILAWRLPDDDARDLAKIAGPGARQAADLPEYHYLHARGGDVTLREPFPLEPPPTP